MSKLKSENGKVQYLFRAGKDIVSASMDEDVAQRIVDTGKNLEETQEHAGYPLCVDGVWFFPLEEQDAEQEQKSSNKVRKAKKIEAEG